MFAQFKPTRKGDFNAYIARSFRNKKGDKTSSVIVERLGLLSEIAKEHPGIDPREWVKSYAAELRASAERQHSDRYRNHNKAGYAQDTQTHKRVLK